MKNNFLILLVALTFGACATKTPKTDALLKDHAELGYSSHIKDVPFVNQKINHCGPATLSMVLKSHGQDVPPKELASQMMTPNSKGSYKMDMISTVRRQGMVGVGVRDLKSLLTEIQAGHPVIVFQNLGFDFYPNWHYSVAIGYDIKGPDIFMHSGKYKNKKVDMRFFERSWSKGGHWGLVVLPPGSLSATGDDLAHTEGIAGLEQTGKLKEAKISYESVLKKWPQSLPALIGMGNVLYAQKDYLGSIDHLTRATQSHPTSSIAWHNLANAQGAAGKNKAAKLSAQKALSLVSGTEATAYEDSLKEFL